MSLIFVVRHNRILIFKRSIGLTLPIPQWRAEPGSDAINVVVILSNFIDQPDAAARSLKPLSRDGALVSSICIGPPASHGQPGASHILMLDVFRVLAGNDLHPPLSRDAQEGP